jgi:hypothetical protein
MSGPGRRATFAAATALAGSLSAQAEVEVDFATSGGGQAAWSASSIVSGLDPEDDGFLAVRTGPGTGFPIVARLKNGAVVLTCAQFGPWTGVLYGASRTNGWCTGLGSYHMPAGSPVLGSGAIASPGMRWESVQLTPSRSRPRMSCACPLLSSR